MIIKEMVQIPYLNCERMLHIYVPDVKKQEQFPVLYMFDGHNLFYDVDATYGKSWGIKDYLENNASQTLADKINNGVQIEKDGKTLINKKDLESFMKYASQEAQKTI